MKKKPNTVLVAIMNSKVDFAIAKTEGWYRIPVKSAPLIVKNGSLHLLAFYHTKIFEEYPYSVRFYGVVKNITIVNRKELFPNEPVNIKTEKEYYKLEFSKLLELERPIVSQRGRRIVFIPTSREKFFNATEINHLFNDSELEDILWGKLQEKKIEAERQFFYQTDEKGYYILDFAIFCKNRNIDVECDGDEFHNRIEAVAYDKNRNNFLESKGWSVLRFTTKNITSELGKTVNIICDTVNNYGGVQDTTRLDEYRYVRQDNDPQFRIFE
jgi:very-short-patch-repair endonuclease